MKDVLQGATLIVNVGDSQREVSKYVCKHMYRLCKPS